MASEPSPRAVLIVDDAEDCMATLDVALQALPGLIIRSVGTAEAAVAVLERETISAMITDLQLPSMNGLELIGWVRTQPKYQSLPIIAVSAAADPAIPAAALESGANAFFPKPFSPGAIRKKVEELMHAH